MSHHMSFFLKEENPEIVTDSFYMEGFGGFYVQY